MTGKNGNRGHQSGWRAGRRVAGERKRRSNRRGATGVALAFLLVWVWMGRYGYLTGEQPGNLWRYDETFYGKGWSADDDDDKDMMSDV